MKRLLLALFIDVAAIASFAVLYGVFVYFVVVRL